MFYLGFSESLAEHCCYLVPACWVHTQLLVSIEEVLLGRQQRHTIIACENQLTTNILKSVVEQVFSKGQAERGLVLDKVFSTH